MDCPTGSCTAVDETVMVDEPNEEQYVRKLEGLYRIVNNWGK